MATEVHTAIVSIPAGTALAAPVTLDVSFNPMVTEHITWRVPRGPVGLMGWRLSSSGAQVIPTTLGAWVIADGQSGTWVLDELHNTGDWQVTAYNTGTHPHSVHLEFGVRPIESARLAALRGRGGALAVTASPDLHALPPRAFRRAAKWAR